MSFKRLNNVAGWIIWLIATITFVLTIEPTTSFWDCGEFIATAFKLEVGHPPGAPLFMIVARFFSLFSGGDVTLVAKMINIMSALASSFTILFLFWTITHLAKKLVQKSNSEELSFSGTLGVVFSGAVGALAFAFSDTFWFSAVEAEVYATSSLFTAVVFWAILKWENVAHTKYANRWIVLIAYLMGLSIGVHLLNLLAIPAIVFVYYFKNFEVTRKNTFFASLISVLILGVVMYGVIPYVVKIASWFELVFVNSFGLPFNTGIIVYAVLLIGGIVWGLYITSKRKKVLANTILLVFSVILIGYSSFTMIVIRSLANPPMDENNPENVFALLSYLNREQYGDRPLMYGQYFNAPLDRNEPYSQGAASYIQKDGEYVIADKKESPNYDAEFCSLFPRMYSSQVDHIDEYMRWIGKKKQDFFNIRKDADGKTLFDRDGNVVVDYNQGKKKPSMSENIKFFIKYQLGHMYFRYFMWNFAGRQNDIQGHGELLNGNWISGIPFIDNARLGDQDMLPDELKDNRARNRYFLLPLLLGIVGLIWQFKKNRKDFWVVMLLYFFTGIAIVIYLNQYPHQPRERDYAYAGSFYAFAIWIGLGVIGFGKLFDKAIKNHGTVAAGLTFMVLVPGIMVKENWDDHDRSGRYTALDFASNYLNSCAPNAILFTNGDNDTFPLWYAQEVEGIRTDVRVINLSLLNTDWYVDQLKRKAYNSEPVPFSLTHDKYVQGTRDYLPVQTRIDDYISVDEVLDFVSSDDQRTKLGYQGSKNLLDFIPSKKILVPVDSAFVVNNGTVPADKAGEIVPALKWNITKSYFLKSDLMILDLLATNNWERPVYFAITVGGDSYLNLQKYFRLEGLAYRLVPIENANPDRYQLGSIQSELMYDNMMNKFKWGGLNNPEVYLDENNLRMTMNFRNNFSRLATQLLEEGKRDSAVAVLDKCIEIMPDSLIPYNYFNMALAQCYFQADEDSKGIDILEKLSSRTQQKLDFYFSLDAKKAARVFDEKRREMYFYQELVRIAHENQLEEPAKKFESNFEQLYAKFIETTPVP